jgi:hypothetical protein
MAPTRGLPNNRAVLIGVLLFCLDQSVTVWLTVTRYVRFPHDPVSIFGLALAAFITTSITCRSKLSVDRLIFGGITITLVLTALRIARLTTTAMVTVKAVEALLWSITAAVGAFVLVRGSEHVRGNG